MIDWKKVAQQRQKTIRAYRVTGALWASDVEQIVYRHAMSVLHCRCVHGCIGLAQEIAESAAKEIAEGPE